MEVLRGNNAKQPAVGQNEPHGTALLLKDEDERRQTIARISEVRAMQVAEGMFDCFGKATAHYCDQGNCTYHAECLSISALISQPFP